MVHLVAHPIAVAIDYVAGTNLKNCRPCIGPGGRRERLNATGRKVSAAVKKILT